MSARRSLCTSSASTRRSSGAIPASVFFTVMLPLIFLFIFATIFGNDEIEERGVKTTTYYVPAIITLAVISATMQSLAINLTQDRERGLLKRVRGTPLPTQTFVAGRVGNSLVVSVLMVVLVAVIGQLVYDVSIPTDDAPGRAGDPGRRRLRLLLPRLRADGVDPTRGRGAGDLQRHWSCRCTSSPASSSRTARSRRGPQLRRPLPDPATSSRRSSPPGTRTPPAPASSWGTWLSSRPGASPGCWSRCASSAGSRAAEPRTPGTP